MAQLKAVGKVNRDTYMSKECSSRDEDHEVDLRLSREAGETPEAEGSYSMIIRDSDSSYTIDPG